MRGARVRRAIILLTTASLGAAVAVPGARAQPPPAPPRDALAPLATGFAWFHDGQLQRLGPSGTTRGPGIALPGGPYGPYLATSSAAGAALVASGSLSTVTTTGRPLRVGVARRGCWAAGAGYAALPVIVGTTLVASADWACPDVARPVRQPLFARALDHGGRWRVLRWVRSLGTAILAADGDELAVGLQRSRSRMEVQVAEDAVGPVDAAFSLPAGYLEFAGPRRVVDCVPGPDSAAGFPLTDAVNITGDYVSLGSCRLALYDLRGRRVARLGDSEGLPWTEGDHLVAAVDAPDGVLQLTERTLPAGRVRRLIGFRDPARSLSAVALRWPRLAFVDTVSAVLPAGQFTCSDGPYGPPSPPVVGTLDLAHPGAYRPPEPVPTPPPWQLYLERCGPAIS